MQCGSTFSEEVLYNIMLKINTCVNLDDDPGNRRMTGYSRRLTECA